MPVSIRNYRYGGHFVDWFVVPDYTYKVMCAGAVEVTFIFWILVYFAALEKGGIGRELGLANKPEYAYMAKRSLLLHR